MSLLQQIDINVRLRPLSLYLEGLEELGIDPNDEAVYPNVIRIFLEVMEAEDIDMLEEMNGRSEYQAGQEMMRGRGVDMDREAMKRRQAVARSGLDNPRLGLNAHDPAPEDRVKLAIGNQIGLVVSASDDEIVVKDRMGNTHEIPRHMLKPFARHNEKTGKNEIVWIEQ